MQLHRGEDSRLLEQRNLVGQSKYPKSRSGGTRVWNAEVPNVHYPERQQQDECLAATYNLRRPVHAELLYPAKASLRLTYVNFTDGHKHHSLRLSLPERLSILHRRLCFMRHRNHECF